MWATCVERPVCKQQPTVLDPRTVLDLAKRTSSVLQHCCGESARACKLKWRTRSKQHTNERTFTGSPSPRELQKEVLAKHRSKTSKTHVSTLCGLRDRDPQTPQFALLPARGLRFQTPNRTVRVIVYCQTNPRSW